MLDYRLLDGGEYMVITIQIGVHGMGINRQNYSVEVEGFRVGIFIVDNSFSKVSSELFDDSSIIVRHFNLLVGVFGIVLTRILLNLRL